MPWLGVQASAEGFIQVEGSWYCPAMPQPLIDATKRHRKGQIDDATYALQIAERKRYAARRNGLPDDEGYGRWLCPASGGACTAVCPLKTNPAAARDPNRKLVPVRPGKELVANPPPSCTQRSVTIGPTPGAKLAQALAYGTEEQKFVYSTLRNSVEGVNGYVKDGAHEGVGDPSRRRILGVAAQSVLVAFQFAAANIRKIRSLLSRRRAAPEKKSRPSRRTSKPLTNWRPEPSGFAVDRESLPDG